MTDLLTPGLPRARSRRTRTLRLGAATPTTRAGPAPRPRRGRAQEAQGLAPGAGGPRRETAHVARACAVRVFCPFVRGVSRAASSPRRRGGGVEVTGTPSTRVNARRHVGRSDVGCLGCGRERRRRAVPRGRRLRSAFRLPDEMLLRILRFWCATTSTGVPL